MAPLALALALLGACASSERSYVDSKVEGAEVDYRARHERMLQLVLLRPAVLEAQRQERERRERELNVEQWDVVMARNEAFVQQRKDTRARDAQAFERLLARQRELNAGRESVRTERWAQFLEKGGAGQSGAATPPAGGGTP
jgi:hypothetical protein